MPFLNISIVLFRISSSPVVASLFDCVKYYAYSVIEESGTIFCIIGSNQRLTYHQSLQFLVSLVAATVVDLLIVAIFT